MCVHVYENNNNQKQKTINLRGMESLEEELEEAKERGSDVIKL